MLSPDRLPVAFRPHNDEALTSWLSRTAAVYGCSCREMLSAYCGFRPEIFDNVDIQPSMIGLLVIQALVGGPIEQLKACTLATAYPHWLPNWISRSPPNWHVTDRRTVPTTDIRPAVCLFCLTEDIDSGRSQYLRLSWLCSITTVCPIHLSPLVTCCSAYSMKTLAHQQDWVQCKRMCCLGCCGAFDRSCDSTTDQQALFAVAHLERQLRAGVGGNRILDLIDRLLPSENLLLFVEDMTWALMLPLDGSPFRVLHSMRTPQFRVPMGFNTPVDADNWLSCGPLQVRRSILAVLSSLLLPAALCGTLVSPCGRGREFWKSMKYLHNAEQRQAFRDRAACWNPGLAEAVEFY
jgi:hypothetical protein